MKYVRIILCLMLIIGAPTRAFAIAVFAAHGIWSPITHYSTGPSSFILPDVCLSPGAYGGYVPVPFPIFTTTDDTKTGVKTKAQKKGGASEPALFKIDYTYEITHTLDEFYFYFADSGTGESLGAAYEYIIPDEGDGSGSKTFDLTDIPVTDFDIVFGYKPYSTDSTSKLTIDSLYSEGILFKTSVPEPTSLALIGLGLIGIGLCRKRKWHTKK